MTEQNSTTNARADFEAATPVLIKALQAHSPQSDKIEKIVGHF